MTDDSAVSDCVLATHVAAMHGVVRPVRDLAASIAFYRDALGFVHDGSPANQLTTAAAAALAAAWGCAPQGWAPMRLGGQWLILAACPAATLRGPVDGGADDPCFQHIAVVASAIGAAWQRVLAQAPGTVAISRGGPQQLPAGAGGVNACKFRDPDGHPVELLAFAQGQVPPRWQHTAPALTLGIDHSAITVADADRSVAFYVAQTGLTCGSRQTNRGPEQERLDGLEGAVVDVVALHPPHATPHLELLGYRPARLAKEHVGAQDCTVWEAAADAACVTLRDPDGHLGLVLPPAHAA